jgi:hypothetical protein
VRNQLDNESIEKEKRNNTRELIASPLSPKLSSTIDLKNAPGKSSVLGGYLLPSQERTRGNIQKP